MKSTYRKNLWRALKRLVSDSPGILPLAVLLAAVEAAYPYIEILLSAEILNELASPDRNRDHLIFLALLLPGLSCLGRMANAFCGQLLDVLQYVEMKRLEGSVAEKAWRMDYSMASDPVNNERRRKLMRWHYSRGVLALAGQTRNFLRACFTIGISAVLVVQMFAARATGESRLSALLNHWLAGGVFLVLFAVPVIYRICGAAKMHQIFYQLDEKAQKPENEFWALTEKCTMQYQKGKDIRLFHMQDSVLKRIRETGGKIADIYETGFRKNQRLETGGTFLTWMFNLFVYLFVGLKAICGAFGVGSILRYTGTVNQLGNGMTLLFDTIRDFVQNLQYVDEFFTYQDMPNRTAEGKLPVTQAIRDDYVFTFRDVTFTYPGAAAPSLIRLNCTFKKGEKLAVVGRNGSGKTTFIKLLCRLYDPQEGEILLNGVDIKQYKYEEYLEFFSSVFQDYMIFAFRLGENVASESDYDEEKVTQALRDAGFGERLDSLEKGLDTQLFQFFSEDGVELSGGESQKVAIARCLYKDAPYVILDEPTAALDPVAEADIYQRMNQFTRDKGAIYISHRLSSCHFCDRILVFEKDRIVEQGTHDALLQAEGQYQKLWHAQAQYYAEE